jgi:small subunit ribosomal protein S4e
MGRRGPKKHLKTLNAPHHWMLPKTSGVYSYRPNAGPHKLRECLPLATFIRNRLHYALSGKECQKIIMGRMVKVDGKVRTDVKFPAGYMDVITLEKSTEHFRLIYDTKGRFMVHRISAEEAAYKLCRVKKVCTTKHNTPFLVTHDGRTLRYPNPDVKVGDSIELDIESTKITNWVKFETGNICHVIGGKNVGRIGTIQSRERHPGSFDIVNVKDSAGHTFATRASNIFLLGKGAKPLVSLPRDKGVRKTIAEERDARIQNRIGN